uniref:Uncharacterized protein n=1 Tax=viral metagenome TaxID=1070528 RepID=A0A6C0BDE6_9ZZZZ
MSTSRDSISTLRSMFTPLGKKFSPDEEDVIKKINYILSVNLSAMQNDVAVAKTRSLQSATKRSVFTDDANFNGHKTFEGDVTCNATVLLSDGSDAASTFYVRSVVDTIDNDLTDLEKSVNGYKNDYTNSEGYDVITNKLYVSFLNLKAAYFVDSNQNYRISFIDYPGENQIASFKIFNKTGYYAVDYDINGLSGGYSLNLISNKTSVTADEPNIQSITAIGASPSSFESSVPTIWAHQSYTTVAPIILT